MLNTQLRLARRPSGEAKSTDFSVTREAVPSPENGQVTVRAEYISIDPSVRTHLNAGQSYRAMVGIGDIVDVPVAGEVVASAHPGFISGDKVTGMLGTQEYAVVDGATLTKVDVSLAPLPSWLGGLGLTGLTAYFGFEEVGKPKPGETVVVTAASGAVGSVAGQIARIKGARAVGICGSDEKCRWLTEDLGFDAAVNYRSPDLYRDLKEATPNRVDVVFDNVGGPLLDTLFRRLGMRGRVIICGATSQYNEGEIYGPKNYLALATLRARMEGFIIFDYVDRYDAARREMAGWMKQGLLGFRENIVEGTVTDYPTVLHRLYQGENVGKMVMRVVPSKP
ncbi:NADP-dependent oxidoreductase [Emcibacter sp. SYSU 3D8]|uniref:NADP-dependent oxidoreductase n=1 Tax=Emcibacter sp. SYSU 3D8 TaxID=3133969 RepID=UPI0031FE9471